MTADHIERSITAMLRCYDLYISHGEWDCAQWCHEQVMELGRQWWRVNAKREDAC